MTIRTVFLYRLQVLIDNSSKLNIMDPEARKWVEKKTQSSFTFYGFPFISGVLLFHSTY